MRANLVCLPYLSLHGILTLNRHKSVAYDIRAAIQTMLHCFGRTLRSPAVLCYPLPLHFTPLHNSLHSVGFQLSAILQVLTLAVGAILHQLGERIGKAAKLPPPCYSIDSWAVWQATGCLILMWLAKEATMLLGFATTLVVPWLDTAAVQSLIVDSDLITGSFIPVMVFLFSCVDLTFYMLPELSHVPWTQDLIRSVLHISLPLYLTHGAVCLPFCSLSPPQIPNSRPQMRVSFLAMVPLPPPRPK